MNKAKKTADNAERSQTKDWSQYRVGIRHKEQIKLYTNTADNYRFFIGDQWHGVDSKGLPQPVFNFIKQITRYKVATVMANDTKIRYAPILTGDEETDNEARRVCADLTRYASVLWEKLKMDYFNEVVVTDAAVAGSGYTYWYFRRNRKPVRAAKPGKKKEKKSEAKVGEFETATGEVAFDVVDATNIFPGDVNTNDIQSQPYIIISFRKHIAAVKKDARENREDGLCHLSDEEIERISGDSDNQYEAGDNGREELTDDGERTKVTVLLKMWRDEESGTIHIRETLKDMVILEDYDTELTLYPLAGFVWEPVKSSFFGQSDITGIIPNQKYANKSAAMIMLNTMYYSFPKMVYDKEMVSDPSNQIGTAIGVSGTNGAPIKGVIDYIAPPSVSGDVFSMFNATINLTKDLMSASDAALGTANTTSASGKAILSQIEAAARPLETTRRRFYGYIEDVANIWFDIWKVYQGESGKRFALINEKTGDEEYRNLTPADLYAVDASVRIDVGPAMRWSEPAVMETLDQLLLGKFISFERYIRSIPDNYGLPKQEILNDLNESAQAAQSAAMPQGEQMAQGIPAQRMPAPNQPAQGGGTQETATDAQIEQFAAAISAMQPAQAKAALEKIAQNAPKVAAQVMTALPPELIKAIREV